MKQVDKTPRIIEYLHQSLGADASTDNLAVYEATALNTLPLRKNHPLYKGARVERSLLLEMAAALHSESRPVQIQHDKEPLPVGRVFHGEVLDNGLQSELRVLFFIEKGEQGVISKLDNGAVDQVSVSILPKQILSSATGFDFLSDEASFEHRYTATDNKGNKLGEKGVYARLVGLDQWMELSLVGVGGAQNARIIHRSQSHFGSSYEKLAASGVDPSAYVLTATSTEDDNTMDLTALVDSLTNTKVELAQASSTVTTLEAKLSQSDAKVTELEAKLADAGDVTTALEAKDTVLAEKEVELTAVTTERDEAVAVLTGIATKVLTASGKPTTDLPTNVTDLLTLINDTNAALVAALSGGGNATGADHNSVQTSVGTHANSFRRPRR